MLDQQSQFEKKQRDREVFGCDMNEFMDSVQRSATVLSGYALVVMSILSDAQELLELSNGSEYHTKLARQTINRAKWLISQKLDDSPKGDKMCVASGGDIYECKPLEKAMKDMVAHQNHYDTLEKFSAAYNNKVFKIDHKTGLTKDIKFVG